MPAMCAPSGALGDRWAVDLCALSRRWWDTPRWKSRDRARVRDATVAAWRRYLPTTTPIRLAPGRSNSSGKKTCTARSPNASLRDALSRLSTSAVASGASARHSTSASAGSAWTTHPSNFAPASGDRSSRPTRRHCRCGKGQSTPSSCSGCSTTSMTRRPLSPKRSGSLVRAASSPRVLPVGATIPSWCPRGIRQRASTPRMRQNSWRRLRRRERRGRAMGRADGRAPRP